MQIYKYLVYQERCLKKKFVQSTGTEAYKKKEEPPLCDSENKHRPELYQ